MLNFYFYKFIICLGLGVVVYSLFFMDVSVGGYANVDLLSLRQNFIIVGCTFLIVGILVGFRSKQPSFSINIRLIGQKSRDKSQKLIIVFFDALSGFLLSIFSSKIRFFSISMLSVSCLSLFYSWTLKEEGFPIKSEQLLFFSVFLSIVPLYISWFKKGYKFFALEITAWSLVIFASIFMCMPSLIAFFNEALK